MLSVSFPLIWFFVKQRRPEYYELLPDGATVKEGVTGTSQMINLGVKYAAEAREVEFTLRQAMRTPAYWLLISAQTGLGMGTSSMMAHFVPFLTDLGMSLTAAANTMALTSLSSVMSRLAIGFVSDRVSISYLSILFGGAILLQSLGLTVFLLNQTMTMMYPLLLLWFIGYGAQLTLMSLTFARYFGRKAFASIRGSSALITMPLGIIAPVYTGWVYDSTGNYITALTVLAVVLGLVSVLMCLARPPKAPAQITDIGKFL